VGGWRGSGRGEEEGGVQRQKIQRRTRKGYHDFDYRKLRLAKYESCAGGRRTALLCTNRLEKKRRKDLLSYSLHLRFDNDGFSRLSSRPQRRRDRYQRGRPGALRRGSTPGRNRRLATALAPCRQEAATAIGFTTTMEQSNIDHARRGRLEADRTKRRDSNLTQQS